MTKIVVKLLMAGAAVSAPQAAAAQAPAGATLAALEFMSGCWRGELGNGGVLEEVYTAPSQDLMLGLSRYLRGDRALQFEFSRITADSTGIALHPFPGGRPSEHAFRLTGLEPGRATFEAPEHDFPKRIRYIGGADGSLTARIDDGPDGSRAQEWQMKPVPCRPAARGSADGAGVALRHAEPLRTECTACSDEPTARPEWFMAELAYLTRDGGRWVADNGAYRTDDEPYRAYGMVWARGVSGNTAQGRLYGIDDGGREHDLWEMYLVWNEIDGAAIVMQVHKDGTFGTGELVVTSDRGELVQAFRAPDGTAFELRHVETRSADERRAQSFHRSGDRWEPRRTYTWMRVRP